MITAIDGMPVACDGSVPLREHDRVQFEHLIRRHQVGDRVDVDVVRAGDVDDARR